MNTSKNKYMEVQEQMDQLDKMYSKLTKKVDKEAMLLVHEIVAMEIFIEGERNH